MIELVASTSLAKEPRQSDGLSERCILTDCIEKERESVSSPTSRLLLWLSSAVPLPLTGLACVSQPAGVVDMSQPVEMCTPIHSACKTKKVHNYINILALVGEMNHNKQTRNVGTTEKCINTTK